jgi:sulfite reductase alpha subunit-like flavoprotein
MKAPIQGQPHDRSALILYGSETGNSQEAAEQLGRITDRLRFVTQVVEMNHVELVCSLPPTPIYHAHVCHLE